MNMDIFLLVVSLTLRENVGRWPKFKILHGIKTVALFFFSLQIVFWVRQKVTFAEYFPLSLWNNILNMQEERERGTLSALKFDRYPQPFRRESNVWRVNFFQTARKNHFAKASARY